MKSMIKKSVAVLIAIIPLLSACQSEPEVGDTLYPTEKESYDAKVYINKQSLPVNASAFDVVKTPVSLVVPLDTVEFYLKLTASVSQDVTVTVAEDADAAAAYNSSATALSAGSLSMLNASVTIPAGATVSAEPIKAAIVESEALRNLVGTGVTALKIVSVTGGATAGSDYNAYYVSFTKKELNIKSQSSSDLAALTKIDQSAFTVTVDGNATTKLTDGSTSTYYYTGYTGYDVVLELAEAQPIAAVTYNYGYSSGYCPNRVEIFTSDDGSTWTSQTGGEYNSSVYAYSRSTAIPYIFYAAINCKYVKIRPLYCSYASYGDSYNTPIMSEINLYTE